jgi:uracil-DNA glycosylase
METNEACLSWSTTLGPEKEQPYFKDILSFLNQEKKNNKTIYPAKNDIFNALKYTSFDNVKVVIIGQDPYHGPNQAHGLCFSVEHGVLAPPSLKNIFKELHDDLGITIPDHGCLKKWADQGVLLLNAVLTVEAGKPQSHAQKGWEKFTDKIIEVINEKKQGIVFLLWGSYAQQKGMIIDPTRHYILKAAHPSPLSVKGFLGCRHFSKTNELLKKQGKEPIDWSL